MTGLMWAMVAAANPPETLMLQPTGGTSELHEELRALRAELREERLAREQLHRHPARAQPAPGGPSNHVPFGTVVSDVVAMGQDLIVEGTVQGDATALGGDVIIRSRGVVLGDAVSLGGRVRVEPGAVLQGDRVGVGSQADLPEVPVSLAQWAIRKAVLALSFVGMGALLVGIFPHRIEGVAAEVQRRPFWSAFVGTVFSTAMIIFCTLFGLLTFGAGLPVSVFGLGVLCTAWMLGFVGFCQILGDRLPLDAPNGRWLVLCIGAITLAFAGSLGWPLWLCLTLGSLIGVGASVSSRFGG